MDNYPLQTLLPGWETVRLLGRGSVGEVYEIRREVLGMTESAALKVITIPQDRSEIDDLRAEGYDEDEISELFADWLKALLGEYAAMARLRGCANVVSCDDLRYTQHENEPGWDVLIKMELLQPLTAVYGRGMEEREILRLGRDIAAALAACHGKQILHRDIKPQNIFVNQEGTWKLGDFGAAASMEKTGGPIVGTKNYMAPEVFNKLPYGPPADIYSLGLVLYWLLNEKRTPFLPLPPGVPSFLEKKEALSLRFRGEAIPAPAHGSPELRRIVLKAVSFDPDKRYRSAEEMLRDLETAVLLSEREHHPGLYPSAALERDASPRFEQAQRAEERHVSRPAPASAMPRPTAAPVPAPAAPAASRPAFSGISRKDERDEPEDTASLGVFSGRDFQKPSADGGRRQDPAPAMPRPAPAPMPTPPRREERQADEGPAAPFRRDGEQMFGDSFFADEDYGFRKDSFYGGYGATEADRGEGFAGGYGAAEADREEAPAPGFSFGWEDENEPFSREETAAPPPPAPARAPAPTPTPAPAPAPAWAWDEEEFASAPSFGDSGAAQPAPPSFGGGAPYQPAQPYGGGAPYQPAPPYGGGAPYQPAPPYGGGVPYQPAPPYGGGYGQQPQPQWGYPPAPVPARMPRVSEVQFSALFPKRFLKGEYSILELYIYEEEQRKVLDEAIAEAGGSLKESRSGKLKVSENAQVSVRLECADRSVEIEGNGEVQTWNGGYLKFDFSVFLPDNYPKRQLMFTATVLFNGVPATKLRFTAECNTQREQKMELERHDVLSAFVSYASQDRSRVAGIIQGMQRARPDMDLFFDVDSLRSGEDWQRALRSEIERRDILFLCWSVSARQSAWVEREWRYALENKGLDCIEPIAIDPPSVCPPPTELESKSFNDRTLYYIQG